MVMTHDSEDIENKLLSELRSLTKAEKLRPRLGDCQALRQVVCRRLGVDETMLSSEDANTLLGATLNGAASFARHTILAYDEKLFWPSQKLPYQAAAAAELLELSDDEKLLQLLTRLKRDDKELEKVRKLPRSLYLPARAGFWIKLGEDRVRHPSKVDELLKAFIPYVADYATSHKVQLETLIATRPKFVASELRQTSNDGANAAITDQPQLLDASDQDISAEPRASAAESQPQRHSRRIVIFASVLIIAAVAIMFVVARTNSNVSDANAFTFAISKVSDENNGTSFALSATASGAARQLLARDNKTGQLPQYIDFVTALSDGAYAVGGLKLYVELQDNVQGSEVTISGIRPVSISRSQPAAGVLVVQPSEGEGSDGIGFDMDASASPLARQSNAGGSFGTSFFDTTRPTLQHGDTLPLTLNFRARTLSFEFSIAVDYEVNGNTYTQLISQNGHVLRFRTTAYLCPGPRPGLPAAEVQHLNQLRYDAVYAQVVPLGAADFVMKPYSPDYFATSCNDPSWTLR